MFMSDNGGCAEFLAEESNRPEPSQYSMPNADGTEVMVGNIPNLRPGPGTTFMSYDLAWANASNSPFRLFKRWTHEGGISTPLIVHWPDRIKQPAIVHEPTHITDIPATCIAAAGATYPTEFGGNPITPIEGQSFMQAIDSGAWNRPKPIFWEHEGSRGGARGGVEAGERGRRPMGTVQHGPGPYRVEQPGRIKPSQGGRDGQDVR